MGVALRGRLRSALEAAPYAVHSQERATMHHAQRRDCDAIVFELPQGLRTPERWMASMVGASGGRSTISL